MKTEKHTN